MLLPLLTGDVEPSKIPPRRSLHRAGVVEAGAVTRAVAGGFGGVPAHGAAQMCAGAAHDMNGTGLVAAGADDLSVVVHDVTLTETPVDFAGPALLRCVRSWHATPVAQSCP